jgi:hypothetical protein
VILVIEPTPPSSGTVALGKTVAQVSYCIGPRTQ